MKKLLYLIMAVCLIASLAACRGMDRIGNNGPVDDAEDGIVDNNGSEDGVIGKDDDGILDRNDADNGDNLTDTEFPENNVPTDGDTVYPGGGIIDGNTENGADNGMNNGTDNGGMGNGTDNGGASNGNDSVNGGNSGVNGTNGTAGGDTSTSGNGNGTVSSGINPGLSVTNSLNNFFRSIARIPLK